jgi:hypothetical protein
MLAEKMSLFIEIRTCTVNIVIIKYSQGKEYVV